MCCREGSDSAQDTATPMDTDALPPHTATNGLASIDSNPTAAEEKTVDGAGIVREQDGEGADRDQDGAGADRDQDGAGADRDQEGELGGEISEGEEPLMNRVAQLRPISALQRVPALNMHDSDVAVDAGPKGAITADSLTVLLTQAIRAGDDVRPLPVHACKKKAPFRTPEKCVCFWPPNF
jgi:hypothetical protein